MAMVNKCIPTPKARMKSAFTTWKARTHPSKTVEKLKSRPESQSHRGRVEDKTSRKTIELVLLDKVATQLRHVVDE